MFTVTELFLYILSCVGSDLPTPVMSQAPSPLNSNHSLQGISATSTMTSLNSTPILDFHKSNEVFHMMQSNSFVMPVNSILNDVAAHAQADAASFEYSLNSDPSLKSIMPLPSSPLKLNPTPKRSRGPSFSIFTSGISLSKKSRKPSNENDENTSENSASTANLPMSSADNFVNVTEEDIKEFLALPADLAFQSSLTHQQEINHTSTVALAASHRYFEDCSTPSTLWAPSSFMDMQSTDCATPTTPGFPNPFMVTDPTSSLDSPLPYMDSLCSTPLPFALDDFSTASAGSSAFPFFFDTPASSASYPLYNTTNASQPPSATPDSPSIATPTGGLSMDFTWMSLAATNNTFPPADLFPPHPQTIPSDPITRVSSAPPTLRNNNKGKNVAAARFKISQLDTSVSIQRTTSMPSSAGVDGPSSAAVVGGGGHQEHERVHKCPNPMCSKVRDPPFFKRHCSNDVHAFLGL
jgi:hypothetical protein